MTRYSDDAEETSSLVPLEGETETLADRLLQAAGYLFGFLLFLIILIGIIGLGLRLITWIWGPLL